MGWAKYTEDNLEIINERLSRAEEKEHYIAKQVALRVTVCIAPMTVTKNKPIAAKRENKSIICKDCGRAFAFSVRDQLFYEKMGWNPPKRCKACREHRKIRHLMCPAY